MEVVVLTRGGARRGILATPVKFERWRCDDMYFVADLFPGEVRVYVSDKDGVLTSYNRPVILFTAPNIEAAKSIISSSIHIEAWRGYANSLVYQKG